MNFSGAGDGQKVLVSMDRIDKSFPGVQALADARLELRRGEVHALVGENGAGKSTLIKILSGAHAPDSGTIAIEGKVRHIRSPIDAQRAGVAVIYQEFNLVPTLSARENIFLGREKAKLGFVSRKDERRHVEELFARIGVNIDPETLCRDLSVAQQQVVEIAKAISIRARVVVMDEPSACLTLQEVERLFNIIRDLKKHSIGIVYISHRLEEIFEVADRVTVMRDGKYIGTRSIEQVNISELIEMMVGRTIENEFPKVKASIGEDRLVVENLCRAGAVDNVSFSVRAGEVLGLTGLVSAGRTEVARLIFGADARDSGRILLDGKELRISSPREAIAAGICLLTEDRKAQGLVGALSARENFALPNLARWSCASFIRQKKERSVFAKYIEGLRIKVADQDQPAGNLSGGNQQKLVLAKWLESHSNVVIFDEPTRGIDVASKYEIYLLINELAAAGKVIIMISSELPEILGMSDRIIVMHDGRISGEITDVADATQQHIMELAIA